MLIIAAIAIAILTSFAAGRGAQAHAVLDHASPRVGSTVQNALDEIILWFTEVLEPAFSRIEVRIASGARVDTGKAHVDRADRTKLQVPLKSLLPGRYEVFWQLLSVDAHTTKGSFAFCVGE